MQSWNKAPQRASTKMLKVLKNCRVDPGQSGQLERTGEIGKRFEKELWLGRYETRLKGTPRQATPSKNDFISICQETNQK